MKKYFFVILLLVFLYQSTLPNDENLSIQNPEMDPLLRKPWISEIRDRELRDYHKFHLKLFEDKYSRTTQDRWGRWIQVYKDGKIRYPINQNYFQKFPHVEDLDLAYYEALSLSQSKWNKEAARVLESIFLCYQLRFNNFQTGKLYENSNQLLNQIIQQNRDKKDFYLDMEPFGCYSNNGLNLVSRVFHFSIVIPENLNYEYTWDPNQTKTKTNQYEAKYFRFYQILNPNEPQSWEDQYFLSELGVSNFKKFKSILFIGALKENQPIFNQNNFYEIWDGIRGLNPSTKREWSFRRKKKEPGYETIFPLVNEKGEQFSWTIREYYYFRDGIGIFLSFSYPTRENETKEQEWNQMVRSLKVRK